VSRDFQLFGRREIERGIMKLPEQWLWYTEVQGKYVETYE
jgi:hypothetical protein